MKKFISTLALFTLFISNAQDIKTTIVVDSAQVKIDASKAIIQDREAQLKEDRKLQKQVRRQQQNTDDKASQERKALAAQQQQLKFDQRAAQKENKNIEKSNQASNDANSLAIKLNEKLIKANDDLVRTQAKFEKAKNRGNLTPVETSEFELKITKKQLKVREIEEKIAKSSTVN